MQADVKLKETSPMGAPPQPLRGGTVRGAGGTAPSYSTELLFILIRSKALKYECN